MTTDFISRGGRGSPGCPLNERMAILVTKEGQWPDGWEPLTWGTGQLGGHVTHVVSNYVQAGPRQFRQDGPQLLGPVAASW